MENILRGQQVKLQALPRIVTSNTERWIRSNGGCCDQKQQGKTPQQTTLPSRAAPSVAGAAAAAGQRCYGPGAVQRLADPVRVCWIPAAGR